MQVSSWNSHDIFWYSITHDIFIDIPMIKDVSYIYPFLGNHPLRSLKLMAAQRPISTVAEFPVCSAACTSFMWYGEPTWKPRKQESLRWPLPKQDRVSIELRNKLGWLADLTKAHRPRRTLIYEIACYGRFPLKEPSDFMTFSYWHLLVPQFGKAGSLYSWT